jgi:maleamate amidohydrolase
VDMTKEWERFFTEKDKEHLRVSGKKQPKGFGENPALILIDIYYKVLGLKREPLLEQIKYLPMGMGLEGWEAVDRTAELLASARKNKIPVIHVTQLEGVIGWSRRPANQRTNIPEEIRQRATEIVEEVAPQAGEIVIRKAAPSAFMGTVLPFELRSMGIDTLIACGESTSGCVRATVVDGASHRFKMGVVAECCFDRTEMSHFVNLFDMHQKYADVIDREEASVYFEKVASGQHS